VADLRRQLEASRSNVIKLEGQSGSLETQLAARSADLARESQERASLERQLSLAQSNSQSLQDKLTLTANQAPRDTEQSETLQARVSELTASAREKDQEIAKREELLQHDRDIRNLIGARDLYIAEIYDVAKTGKTQKPFGRVFYTKGKSLVFYAYDLDQQPGVKLASTFQAWGRKGVDQQRDINLGIFYQDEQNKKRWVLKSNDSATLAQLDAVFVTVEPNGESAKPTGKPLLFTYLRLTPNHP
jgi:DNA repair exonuclease SbcCD ATPase subunit